LNHPLIPTTVSTHTATWGGGCCRGSGGCCSLSKQPFHTCLDTHATQAPSSHLHRLSADTFQNTPPGCPALPTAVPTPQHTGHCWHACMSHSANKLLLIRKVRLPTKPLPHPPPPTPCPTHLHIIRHAAPPPFTPPPHPHTSHTPHTPVQLLKAEPTGVLVVDLPDS
jgi:hypothetical protein